MHLRRDEIPNIPVISKDDLIRYGVGLPLLLLPLFVDISIVAVEWATYAISSQWMTLFAARAS